MIYRAIVRDSRDPSGKGRIKVSIPSQMGTDASDWVWPVVNAGYVVIPKAGDQVWVAYENGDDEVPVWLGATNTTQTYDNLINRVKAIETWITAHNAAHSGV
jgi:uncharacterized protein involved in type VI secretion and phage assembly